MQAQAPLPVLPAEIRHVFDPPGSPGLAQSITPAADGSVLLLTGGTEPPSSPQIFRVTSRGEPQQVHEFETNETPWHRLVPAPGGGFYGVSDGAYTHRQGGVFHITADGAFRRVYSFTGGADGAYPERIAAGSDGNTYVSTFPTNFPLDSNTAVLVIRADGTIVPNAFTAPGVVLAVDATGVAYGAAGRCNNVCGLDLFLRRPDGSVEWIRRVASDENIFGPDMAWSAQGGLVGVTPVGFGDSCVVFRYDGAYQELASIPTGQDLLPCYGHVRWDPAGGFFVGIAGQQVFRVSAAGVFSTLRAFDLQEGTPADVTSMPSGETWAAVGGAGAFTSPCQSASAIVRVMASAPLPIIASLGASRNSDGTNLYSPVVVDPDGTVYGVARDGGAYNAGTVYRATPAGAFSRLYTFSCGNDGGRPAGLVRTSTGALFGTTTIGAGHSGTVFEIGRSGNLRTHFVFRRAEDGGVPGPLVAGPDGAVYGWTNSGGLFNRGTAFRVSASGVFSKLHDFSPDDGIVGTPASTPVLASDGMFYGISFDGIYCTYNPTPCRSSLFRMTLAGAVTVLTSGERDELMDTILLEGPDGRLYGSFFSSGKAFAVTRVGQLTRFPQYARLQVVAPDGGLYDLDLYRGGRRMTTTGLITAFDVTGLPASLTWRSAAGSSQICATGQVSETSAGLIYCVPFVGPIPPGNVRIAR